MPVNVQVVVVIFQSVTRTRLQPRVADRKNVSFTNNIRYIKINMGTIDLWIRDVFTYYGTILLGCLIIAWIVTRLWHRFKEQFFRTHLLCFETEVAELAAHYKKQLFEPLRKMESHDEILRLMGRIRILEIGVKTGENIQYYPDESLLIGVDLNKKLGDYLTGGDRAWQFGHVYFEKLIIGDGSSLKGIPSACVDVVVTTRSLCSTSSIRDTLKEIQRVLAPGGKYFFMEHVPDSEGTFAHWLQKFLTKTKIWPSLFGDCRLDFDPIKNIEKAGFKDIAWKFCTLEGYVSQPHLLFLTRHHVVGTATR